MSNYDQVFWLNVTNIVLGLVTLACVLVIGYVRCGKSAAELGKATSRAEIDDHSFVVTRTWRHHGGWRKKDQRR